MGSLTGRVVAYIPVRGGSKSIPLKNIKPLAGRPLVHWTAGAALAARGIDRVYVASDSPRIRAVTAELHHDRLYVIDRSAASASDTASTESAMIEFAEAHPDAEWIVLIQATSPLLTADDLDGALARLAESGADSLLSVTHEHRFRWALDDQGRVTAQNYRPQARPRRQDWAGELYENGALYITRRAALLETGCRLSGAVVPWIMPTATAFEIDEPADWHVLDALIRSRASATADAGDIERARRLKLLVTDVDGTLTDAGMYYSPEGDRLKKFNTRDGKGLARARQAGIEVAIMTGEDSPIVARRAEKLKIDRCYLGVADKPRALGALIDELGLDWSQVAFIGDDLNDLEVIERVGFGACPRDAAAPVRAAARYRSPVDGGAGCVRDFVEHLLALRSAEPAP